MDTIILKVVNEMILKSMASCFLSCEINNAKHTSRSQNMRVFQIKTGFYAINVMNTFTNLFYELLY